ncbi:MAG: hypothetical protein EOO62_22505 [Hymenobacter sp.]|nr:MAG: hypothetical protein EOO62_22505 [Hymenobacter sp.]
MPTQRVAFAAQLGPWPTLPVAASVGDEHELSRYLPGSRRLPDCRCSRAFAPGIIAAGTDAQQLALRLHRPPVSM